MECYFQKIDAETSCEHSHDLVISCQRKLKQCFKQTAELICIARECNETDIKLVDGQKDYDGRVQACLGGLWGSICQHKWDYLDAKVVCRQLGYDGSMFFVYIMPEFKPNIKFFL